MAAKVAPDRAGDKNIFLCAVVAERVDHEPGGEEEKEKRQKKCGKFLFHSVWKFGLRESDFLAARLSLVSFIGLCIFALRSACLFSYRQGPHLYLSVAFF